MIKDAVNKLVEKIGKEEIREEVKNAVQEKVDNMVTEEINNVLQHGIKDVIKASLVTKLEPVVKAIEAIKVSGLVDKVEEINLGAEIDEMVEQLSNKLKGKLTTGIEQADDIKVDITGYTNKMNEIIGEKVIDITEDDEEVEMELKKKVLQSVKDIKVGNQ